MNDIFTVASGEAAAIQMHYEQIIEVLLQTLLSDKQDHKRQGLKIFDGKRLVYGHDKIQFHDEVSGLSGQLLNPQLIVQLQQLRSVRVGGMVEGATNKIVELDGRIVLQSDERGKVIINNLLQNGVVKSTNNQQRFDVDEPTNREHPKQFDNTEFLVSSSERQAKAIQENRDFSHNLGSIRVMQSLQDLEDNPLKNLLANEIGQLQAEIKALRQQQDFYQNLINERVKQHQNISWWQQSVNNISLLVESINYAVKMGIQEFKQHSAQYQIATSLKTLFHTQTHPGALEYQAAQYQIYRDGSLYKITESETGKLLMQFRSTNLGVRVEARNLEPTHIKDINALVRSLQRHEPIPASFTPVGKQEAEYFARIDKITKALVQYAIAHKKDVEIDGLFSYKWQATTDGKVNIYAKDGRGTVLEKSEGQLKSSMSERDLIYFEQILPRLQPAYQRQQESTALRLPQVNSNENELEI
ncbi:MULTISPECIES: hypothetical protein [unclassified Tolypothrix]|uniref:hypothetical protein n=1 Tax=unclassified Tolypothrix TaxID=2649714 RepID=UPI0005EAB25C|nr:MULTISPECIES: hypothetical protein [unclassified Tolypothrix]BAY95213.1 hypothetical protein NIES3275_72700 [Microchaete diplosiphon NIES-3275]EKE98078.1 hypothetical protein FDUTEX481_04317 [Tolypothrix sp. PCC 7601]MBE9085379.1 hypothetical protein [Tolypothrix sp. LEGE 11397]UYD30447.1 hypothetical protein HGR01_37025 [Tolypothrix sp. PCC 7712]UYD38419.1 hypothetical protein HG267_37875 [Tolypothrix sp. PCC 7601]